MRRNEKIYKIPQTNSEPISNNRVYRVFPGGDEFVIIILGEQWTALGFSNRLVDMFNEITMKTPDILGSRENLFFSCIIVEMKNIDSYDLLLSDIQPGYKTAKEGGTGFNIYWHPRNIERTLNPTKDQKKLKEYEQARNKFNVTIPSDNEYGL